LIKDTRVERRVEGDFASRTRGGERQNSEIRDKCSLKWRTNRREEYTRRVYAQEKGTGSEASCMARERRDKRHGV